MRRQGKALKTSFGVLRLCAQAFSRRVTVFCVLAAAAFLGAPASAAIGYVQSNWATPQGSFTSATVTYSSAQTAGNLNVVIVGWENSTANVSSVTDSKGNTYALAVGPTRSTGNASLAMYTRRISSRRQREVTPSL
jgi:hypothetical protein